MSKTEQGQSTTSISNILTKYDELIRITDINTQSVATVSIVAKNFPQTFDSQELITAFVAIFTEALLLSQKNNHQVYDVLVDCKGATAKNIDYKFAKTLIAVMKSTFNDTMGRCVIFNTNQIFRTAYSILSPLIDKPTKAKIKVF